MYQTKSSSTRFDSIRFRDEYPSSPSCPTGNKMAASKINHTAAFPICDSNNGHLPGGKRESKSCRYNGRGRKLSSTETGSKQKGVVSQTTLSLSLSLSVSLTRVRAYALSLSLPPFFFCVMGLRMQQAQSAPLFI